MLRSFLPASAVACAAASALTAMCGRPVLPVPSSEGGFDLVDGSLGRPYAHADDYPPNYRDFDGAEVASVLYTYEHLTFQGGPRPRFETDAFFKATLALLRKFRRHREG